MTLEQAQIERILEALGLSRVSEPDLSGLRALYGAWCRRVPFDNILKRIHLKEGRPGPLPGDDPAEFFEAWLSHGTGGTCWAGNGALQALLLSLGFNARRGVATMLVAPDIPPNHGTVSVDLEGELYLVDASILFGNPLPMRAEETTGIDHPAWGVSCARSGDYFTIRWRPFHAEQMDCRIDSFEGSTEDYRAYHEATRAWSPFNYALSARLIVGNRVIGAGFGLRGAISSEGVRESVPFAEGERSSFLVDELGISEQIATALPPDDPMPPPPKRM